MSRNHRADPVAGRAFFARGPLFVCALLPPPAGEARRCALLAFDTGSSVDPVAYAAALEFARHVGGRHYALLVERVAPGSDRWPTAEPTPKTEYVIERDGFVVFAPSVEAWVSMPPARSHHLLQLVAALPRDDEAAACAVLAELGTLGMVARVRAVLHCGSGAEMDAVVCAAGALEGGYFPSPNAAPREASPDDARQALELDPIPRPKPVVAPLPMTTAEWNALLDAALAASPERHVDRRGLEVFLQQHYPGVEAAPVVAALDAVVATATDYLWAQQPGVSWSDAFEQQYFHHLAARHPWLAPAGFAALLRYSRWLCWHEGLNA